MSHTEQVVMRHLFADKYETIEQLGRGSQGFVSKVINTQTNTLHALKVLTTDLWNDPDALFRFEQEAQLLSRLQHDGIVRVFESGRDKVRQWYFLVMDYIPGKTLRQHLDEQGPRPVSEVLSIARQVAKALIYAHTHTPPIIHRDIKPSNIIIEEKTNRVVVIDFGIAKVISPVEHHRTKTGTVVGTPKYAAPEQLRREPLTGATDVYALGMVMYELYTGAHCLAGLNNEDVFSRVARDPEDHPLYFPRLTPVYFAQLLSKATAKSPEKRHRSMSEFLTELIACEHILVDDPTLPMPAIPQPAPPGNPVEALEEQLRRLQEERRFHILLSLQAEVREARGRAERAEALRWAETLYQQALSHEKSGSVLFQEQQPDRAQEEYQEALTLFTRAGEAAVAFLVHQTDQRRRAVEVAQVEAESQHAPVHARTLFERAQEKRAEGEELFTRHQLYGRAKAVYEEARVLFEDACHLARQIILKEDTERVRDEVRSAQAATIAAGATETAPEVCQQAAAKEEEARTAWDRGDVAQAHALYTVVIQKYDEARQRHDAALAAQRAQTARQQADRRGSQVRAHALYQQAVATHQQADADFAATAYEQARSAYETARQQYEDAPRAAEQDRWQQAVIQAREKFATAQDTAVTNGVWQESTAETQELQRVARIAQQCEENGNPYRATACYLDVTLRLQVLAQKATRQPIRPQQASEQPQDDLRDKEPHEHPPTQQATNQAPEFDDKHIESEAPSSPPQEHQPRAWITAQGEVDASRFEVAAFTCIQAAAAEMQTLGNRTLDKVHLFIGLTRGPFFTKFFQRRTAYQEEQLAEALRVLRAGIRTFYERQLGDQGTARVPRQDELAPEVIEIIEASHARAKETLVREAHILQILLEGDPEITGILQKSKEWVVKVMTKRSFSSSNPANQPPPKQQPSPSESRRETSTTRPQTTPTRTLPAHPLFTEKGQLRELTITGSLREVLQCARGYRDAVKKEALQTPFVFVAMLDQPESHLNAALRQQGINARLLRQALCEDDDLGQPQPVIQSDCSPRISRVLQVAVDYARQERRSLVNERHILQAILEEEDGPTREALVECNVDMQQLRASCRET